MAEIIPVGQSRVFNYTGGMQSIQLPPGRYKLEVWGAQGGVGYSNAVGGKGGYSSGIITLSREATLYVYVGGNPGSTVAGGFNGGGSGNKNRSDNGGGGGGTDMRIGSTSLYARVIVAGGGGGGCHAGTTGYGGGITGGGSYPGGQTYAGSGGSFGQGANIVAASGYPTGGAGGGWYGGGGLTNGASAYQGNGGGSGYVYTADTASSYPSGCQLNRSYYLTDAATMAGNTPFPAPSGGTETGHSGHGYAKITCVAISQTAGSSMIFNYTGAEQSVTLPPGSYFLECYGAQGGSSNGGKGGYASGILELEEETKLYVYVGGQGQYGTPFNTARQGGFNGGGASGTCNSDNGYVTGNSSGGGASDIRIKSNSLYARVLVAGGGGGGFLGSYACIGGTGGGLNGGNGVDGCCTKGYGATQTGCPRNTATCPNGSAASAGTFGQGSSGTYSRYTAGAGGGGGWYGGQASSSGCGGASAGGGSGYVYHQDSASNYPSGCLLDSRYYLGAPELIGGVQSGNGLVRITDVTPKTLLTGDVQGFGYFGKSQKINLHPGVYKLEAWGACGGQGADGTISNTSWNFGYGGYSKGILTIWKPTTLYVTVGGRGQGYNGSTHTAGVVAGGYNGGGNAYHDGGEFGGSGGGATHFALADGVLSSLDSRRDDILLVAGGGGGSGEDNETAGHGGSAVTAPTGAYDVNANKGAFGQGDNYVNTGESGGGGGGGYYGGYGGRGGGSNGGTGYANSILTEVEGSTGVNTDHGYALITAIMVNNIAVNKTKGIASVSSDPDVTESLLPENTMVAISAVVSPGYDFDRWDIHYDASNGVFYTSELSFEYLYTGSYPVAFTAYATPHTNTPYVVNHYIMDSDGQTYVLYQADELQGTTDTTAKADTLSLQYYVTPATQNININGDGTTVINYYYARQKFKLKVFEAVTGGKDTTLYNEDAYWGKPIFLSTTALPGYTFTAWMHDGTEYAYIESQNYPFEMPTRDLTLRPLFTPHDVEYIVYHKLLGDDLSTYETFETDYLQGLTDTNVTPVVKQYNYYDSPATQTVKVNGDGSTVVNYLYSRTAYTLQLTADKGKNAMSAPTSTHMWGKSVSITVTTLAGYAFEQWFDVDENLQFANTATYTFLMPHKDLSLNAVINPFEVKYTVQHHVQALEGGYQIRDTEEIYALTDTEVTPEFKDYEGFSPTSSLETVNVNGDGSTLVIYYYERHGYTLIIKYGDEDIAEAHYFFQESVDLYFDNKARLEPLHAFKKWYTDTEGLLIKQPFMTHTSFLMPARDGYIEAIIGENRKNTNIYKNIFPDEPFDMDVAYKYEQQLEKVVLDITQEKHGFAVGNVLCVIDGVYKKARAEDSPLGHPVGIVCKVISENEFQLMKSGTMPYKEQSFTDTTILYLSNLVAGGLGHYKYITNKVYVPVAFYLDGKIIVSIQQGSAGSDLAPYEEYENVSFEPYTESELNDCVAIVLGGISE